MTPAHEDPLRVLVTAGAAGLGRAVVGAFVAAGARVHVADVDAEGLDAVRGTSTQVSTTVCDVSDAVAVSRLLDDVRASLGGLDVLVNNAGIAGETAPVSDYDVDVWRRVLEVNLTGTFLVSSRALPLLVDSSRGSVITISSVAGRFGYENRVAYSTSKWGLVGLAKTIALEAGPRGVTSNVILPGPVEGDRLDRVFADRASRRGTTPEEERQQGLADRTVHRFAEADDVAALAVFLAGPHARAITGETFPVDGGAHRA